jgi:hypothetical protein
MRFSHRLTHTILTLLALLALSAAALAADPGLPATGPVIGDQQPGNMLVFNLYTSSIANPGTQNTRINVTNVNDRSSIFVHLFFVDGSSCGVADSYICLTPNQTMSIMAADVDPGITGYIIALATDSSGIPLSPVVNQAAAPDGANVARQGEEGEGCLIGDEFVKLETGETANLGAEATNPIVIPPDGGGPIAEGDNLASALPSEVFVVARTFPRVLAVSNIASTSEGNNTLLVINRMGGDLRTSAGFIGNLFGILYDQLENPYSWTFTANVCQLRRRLSNDFPRTTPRFNQVIPSGASGWMKFWSTSTDSSSLYGTTTRALLGVAINFNPNAGSNANAFNQGHNLHKLTLNPLTIFTVPVFPPHCS